MYYCFAVNKNQMAIPMLDQLQMFTNYIRRLHVLVGRAETNHILNNSLFLVASGSDDFVLNYFSYPMRKLEYDIPSFVDYLVSKASTFLQVKVCTLYVLYKNGSLNSGITS